MSDPVKGTTGHTIDPRGVDHPRHYNIHPAGIECIDVIEYMTANVALAIKHVWRAGLKEGEATLKDKPRCPENGRDVCCVVGCKTKLGRHGAHGRCRKHRMRLYRRGKRAAS